MKKLFLPLLPRWGGGAPGAAAALFLARVLLEASGRPWPGLAVVAVGLLAAPGGFFLGRWAARRRRRTWPALLLLAYVFWPVRAPAVAAAVALLTLLLWALPWLRTAQPRRVAQWADALTFLTALGLYAASTSPDVLPADAGEFQYAATFLGVAHPPGYPLYTMVGHLFIRLIPWGTPAWRLNLLSALLAAATLLLLGRAVRIWARRLGAQPPLALLAGLIAALTLGSATTFWAQATIANIRMPTAFFTALALYALARLADAAEPRQADRALTLLALALSLGLTHHPSLAFPGLFFVLYALLVEPRLLRQPRRWGRPALAALLGLLPLVYLPVRGAMGALHAPPDLATWSGFLDHVLARGFAGDMFAFANAVDLPQRLTLLPTLFTFQFNLPLLVAVLLTLLALLRRDRRLCLLLSGSLALHTFVAITYRAPQTVEYLMPAYLPLAVAIGLLPAVAAPRPRPAAEGVAGGLRSLSRTLQGAVSRLRRGRPPLPLSVGLRGLRPALARFLAALVVWAALLNGWAHGPSFFELARDRSTRQVAQPMLESAPPGARLLADWHWVTPLRYLQLVEGLRPDVELVEVYPVAGQDFRQTWRQRAAETPPEQPLLTMHAYTFEGMTSEPWQRGFRLHWRPLTEPTAPLTPAQAVFGGRVTLLGFSLGAEEARAGQVLQVTLAWRASGPLDPQPSFTLRLVDATGRHVAQADRALESDVALGEVRFERLALPLYAALPPGDYRLTLGAYTVSGEGFQTLADASGAEAVTLTGLTLLPATRAPLTLHPRQVPFAGDATLVGVDYDRSVPDVLRVYLHWRGPSPAATVRLRAADGTQATAALPAIPAQSYQTLSLDLPAGVGPLWLALVDGGAAAGPWGWAQDEVRLPAAAPQARFVPMGDEMVLTGVDVRASGPGARVAVDLTWVAARPLTADDRSSVRLLSAEGQWLGAHDGQPALGALPTLKWIRGSRVVDRHVLELPDDWSGGALQGSVVVYEWFWMNPLVPLDGRFSQVPLGTWTLR